MKVSPTYISVVMCYLHHEEHTQTMSQKVKPTYISVVMCYLHHALGEKASVVTYTDYEPESEGKSYLHQCRNVLLTSCSG